MGSPERWRQQGHHQGEKPLADASVGNGYFSAQIKLQTARLNHEKG
ncbi:MAG: hypothetical protein ABIR56_19850 [Polaromonas sp.]